MWGVWRLVSVFLRWSCWYSRKYCWDFALFPLNLWNAVSLKSLDSMWLQKWVGLCPTLATRERCRTSSTSTGHILVKLPQMILNRISSYCGNLTWRSRWFLLRNHLGGLRWKLFGKGQALSWNTWEVIGWTICLSRCLPRLSKPVMRRAKKTLCKSWKSLRCRSFLPSMKKNSPVLQRAASTLISEGAAIDVYESTLLARSHPT